MIVAISAKGSDLGSAVDPRFGRAAYLIFVDTETMEFEAVDNSANAKSFKGAGIQAATMIYNKGAAVLMTGYCGPNAFQTLQAAGIKVVSEVSGTVAEAVARVKADQVEYLGAANAEAHW